MKKEQNIKEFQKMYDDLNDPEKIAAAKRKADIEKIKEDKIKDTGLDL